jgi:hypothetical protein
MSRNDIYLCDLSRRRSNQIVVTFVVISASDIRDHDVSNQSDVMTRM